MDNMDIVRGSFLRKKTSLGTTNDGREEKLNAISNDLGDDLILGVAKINGSKVSQRGNIVAFWDKAEVSRICIPIHLTESEGCCAKLQEGMTYGVLIILEQEKVYPIRPRGFIRFEAEDNFPNFSD